MFRLSLRELFVLVAAAAFAIVSLVCASPAWQAIVSLIALLTAIAAVITSLIDRGPARAFAIGYAIAMLGYLLGVVNMHKLATTATNANIEFDLHQGRLPTSLLLRSLWYGCARENYFDATTGKPIPKSEAANLMVIAQWNGGGFVGGGGGIYGGAPSVPAGKRAALSDTRPAPESFMAVGHLWWAILFGYVGGHFGRFVYLRRIKDEPRPT
ncbi:MAG: hypothetical protein U0805_21430 [Pirellulales bacterium]